MEERVRGVALPAECLDLFDRPLLASVATLLDDGSPHVTPVWIMRRGDRLLLNTATTRGKARNLERDPRIALCILDPDDSARYVHVRGMASLSTEGAREVIDELSHQYTGADFRALLPGEARINIVVTPHYVDYHPVHDLTKAIRVRIAD
ncbi:MAG TPA: PPOX class F420-dependent oxidoreductase [Egibacteraceae bacterium]|nr:PPOX class F420-dependent oxidoreductase [Egibacteraceae bacterium]